MPNNLTGNKVRDTYQYLLQTRDGGTSFQNGIGEEIPVGGTPGATGNDGANSMQYIFGDYSLGSYFNAANTDLSINTQFYLNPIANVDANNWNAFLADYVNDGGTAIIQVTQVGDANIKGIYTVTNASIDGGNYIYDVAVINGYGLLNENVSYSISYVLNGVGGGSSTPIEVTYAELVDLLNNGDLIPFNNYLITDYQTVYDQPDYYYQVPLSDTNTLGPMSILGTGISGEVEPLIVRAASANLLYPEAISTLHPSDKILYDISFAQTSSSTSAKGRIKERIDTVLSLRADYDWRVVEYRRYWRYVTLGAPNISVSFDFSASGSVQFVDGSSQLTIYADTPGSLLGQFNAGDIVYFNEVNWSGQPYKYYKVMITEVAESGDFASVYIPQTGVYPAVSGTNLLMDKAILDRLEVPVMIAEEYPGQREYDREYVDNLNTFGNNSREAHDIYLGNYYGVKPFEIFDLPNSVLSIGTLAPFTVKTGVYFKNNTFINIIDGNHFGDYFYNNLFKSDIGNNWEITTGEYCTGNIFHDDVKGLNISSEVYNCEFLDSIDHVDILPIHNSTFPEMSYATIDFGSAGNSIDYQTLRDIDNQTAISNRILGYKPGVDNTIDNTITIDPDGAYIEVDGPAYDAGIWMESNGGVADIGFYQNGHYVIIKQSLGQSGELELPNGSGTLARLEDFGLALPDTEIVFGNGTGLTSSIDLTWDDISKNLIINGPVGRQLILDGISGTQVMGDFNNAYGGSNIQINNNEIKNIIARGNLLSLTEVIFTGSGIDDCEFTGVYSEADSPAFTVEVLPNLGAVINYTITSGDITGLLNEITFDNAAVATMFEVDGIDTMILLMVSGDPSGATTFTVTSGPDTGTTGNVNAVSTGDSFTLNCSSVFDSKVGVAIYHPATINGITANLPNQFGHNSGDTWQTSVSSINIASLDLDFTNKVFTLKGEKSSFQAREGGIFAGYDDGAKTGIQLTTEQSPLVDTNGLVLNYYKDEDNEYVTDIFLGNVADILRGSSLELYEDVNTKYLAWFSNDGIVLESFWDVDKDENKTRYFKIGDINGNYAGTNIELDDNAKTNKLKGRLATYSDSEFTGFGLDDIIIHGDYTGLRDTETFTIEIIGENVQVVQLTTTSLMSGDINIGDSVICTPGSPGPSIATGTVIGFLSDSPFNVYPLVQVSSPDIFFDGGLFTNITTGFTSSISAETTAPADYVEISYDDTFRKDFLEIGDMYLSWGMYASVGASVGHTIGDIWELTITTVITSIVTTDFTKSITTIGSESGSRFELNSRHNVSSFEGCGNAYESRVINIDYNINQSDRFIDVDFATSSSINLPLINDMIYDGQLFTISDITGNSSLNTITINTNSGDTIKGLTAYSISNDYGSVTIKSVKNNNSWILISVV